MQQNTTSELQESFEFNQDIQKRYELVQSELMQRQQLGLIPPQGETGQVAIASYLRGVAQIDPVIDVITTQAAESFNALPACVETIVTIPILGLNDQELRTAEVLIDVLSQQQDIISGKVAAYIYVNWPEGRDPDNVLATLKKLAEGLPIYIFGSPVPKSSGRAESPLYTQSFQELQNGPQIALIRDILNITVMKGVLASGRESIPITLQLDADLIRASESVFRNIRRQFLRNPQLQFLQCMVDWDGDLATSKILPILIGSILMRELPWQILKKPLNQEIDQRIKMQIIFSDAIQRGIQVVQAERLDAIAKKGGYGLLKIHEDELDLNMRSTAQVLGARSVGSSDDLFTFSNRRAVMSWFTQAVPPISQWITAFEIDDIVRTQQITLIDAQDRIKERGLRFEIINAVKLTLQRFAIPFSLEGLYTNPVDPILFVLGQIGLTADVLEYALVSRDDGTYYIDILNISDEGIRNLITILSQEQ